MARWILLVGLVSGSVVMVWHELHPIQHPLDRVVPLGFAVLSLIGLLVLRWRPRRARRVMLWLSLALALLLATSTAVFVAEAWIGQTSLVDTLPASAVAVICTLIIQLVFLPPRTVRWIGLLSWAPVALPVMVYFIAHPAELITRRGQELMLLFGPACLMIFVLLPFRAATERRLVDLQRRELRARVLASRDPLTALFNRRAFELQLANVIAQSGGAQQLILFDVDRFKSINDRLGHPIGDQVLVEVSRRCASLLDRGELLARWGGEEFAALCREHPSDPAATANAMREILAATPIGEAGIVSASFGVTRVRDSDDLESALSRADQALYRAKQGGRNRVELG